MSLAPSCRVPFSNRALRRGFGALVVAALGLSGLGCASATATTALVTTDPNTFVARTGAPGYADPATPALRTVPVSTAAELKAALSGAVPGDAIVLASGTYSGPFSITTSGTFAHPVVLHPAAGAAVTLRANLPYPTCATLGPDQNRTLEFGAGVSHWVVKGLTINGGLMFGGANSSPVTSWQGSRINSGDWQARRAVPGTSAYDPSTTAALPSNLSSLVGVPVTGAEDMQILGNTITGKGIYGRLSRYGVFSGNTITHIACGTGPGVWLSIYSHGNVLSGNDVSDVARSTANNYMQEGIRLGNASDYNVVTGNFVHNLPVGGRGITTDQDSSFNLITMNTADSLSIGYNEEMSGWSNVWTYNTVSNANIVGFSIRMVDSSLTAPSQNSSSYNITMSCNTSTSSHKDFQAGALSGGTFAGNSFSTYQVNPRLTAYWGSAGNTWNGISTAPKTGVTSPGTTSGC